jgi:hypothetical protein
MLKSVFPSLEFLVLSETNGEMGIRREEEILGLFHRSYLFRVEKIHDKFLVRVPWWVRSKKEREIERTTKKMIEEKTAKNLEDVANVFLYILPTAAHAHQKA